MKDRIYICHTYYHAYVAFLKELALPLKERKHAALMLSSMSNQFENFGTRAMETGLWEDVLSFDEKKAEDFPELARYKVNQKSLVRNLLQRMQFTRRFAQLEKDCIPVDLKSYGEVYVFCDSDPIGYYLNQYKIPYHALEDGLNCLVHFDAARFDNRGHFELKAFLSRKLNLIFVQNGYGKYCIDMEVNDIKAIEMPCPSYIELPRKALVERLTQEDKEIILSAFVRDKKGVEEKLALDDGTKKTLLLTDPLCDLATRKQIFTDIADVYRQQGQIFIKPHPRDLLDYREVFPKDPIFDATMPMEMLNFFPHLHFDTVVTVFTDLNAIDYADKKVRLGNTFMDRYEDPTIHNQNRQAGIRPEKDDEL